MKRLIKSGCMFLALTLAMLQITPSVLAQTKREKRREREKKTPTRVPPVLIVNNPAPQYLSGEVSVAVRGNENPIIRLGLAQNGVGLIEFPASDRFFAINPGNPDLVTIEDSPTKETDRFFVMRPSSGFAPAPEGVKALSPATSIIVQMNSGMVVTFLIYPARNIEHNAHRCVVMYDPKAITDARRAAGLAINLDRLDRKEEVLSSKQQTGSIRPTSSSEPLSNEPPKPPEKADPAVASQAPIPSPNNDATSKSNVATKPTQIDYPVIEGKEKWSKTLHGLKIAAQTTIVDAKQRHVLVTVRNTLSTPIKIVPGHPELQIQTLDEKGRVLQVEPVARLKFGSSTTDGMIGAKQTARYQLTYEVPVLGAKQRLSVAVAQVNAADEPVTMELTAGTR
ncbi:MAG: hypothetical protein JST85_18480 [Acidobacteria bacterium]|nr:hypothetical protein [Acidobacteriota bacterium]